MYIYYWASAMKWIYEKSEMSNVVGMCCKIYEIKINLSNKL